MLTKEDRSEYLINLKLVPKEPDNFVRTQGWTVGKNFAKPLPPRPKK